MNFLISEHRFRLERCGINIDSNRCFTFVSPIAEHDHFVSQKDTIGYARVTLGARSRCSLIANVVVPEGCNYHKSDEVAY